jgi:trimeric autotransporter adhesin
MMPHLKMIDLSKGLIATAGLAVALIWAVPAAAQVGASCSVAEGWSADVTGNNRYCNNSTVTYPAYWFGSTTTSCSSSTAGLAQWTGSELEYCNNSSTWKSFLSGVTTGAQYDLVYYPTTGAGLTADSKIITDANNVLDVASTTITSSDPVLSLGQAWNSSSTTFTALSLTVTNNASASGSMLAKFLVGTTTEFKVDESGNVTAEGYVNAISLGSGLEITTSNAISFPTGDTTAGGSIAIGSNALATETAAGSAAYGNTAVGYDAMDPQSACQYTATNMTTAAINNVAVGWLAMCSVTSGYANVAIGQGAGEDITTGYANVEIGTDAYSTTTGCCNVGLGNQSALGNGSTEIGAQPGVSLSGQYEVAIGGDVLGGSASSTLTGNNNIAVGANTLSKLKTTGANNTAFGDNAGSNLTTGVNNTVIGYDVASATVTTAAENILIGTDSTTGSPLLSTTSAIGIGTGAQVVSTDTAFGYQALKSTGTNSNDNVAIGYQALKSLTTGTHDTAIGYSAGQGTTGITVGVGDTFVGYDAQATAATTTGSTALGYLASVTTSNTIVLGNSSITSINAQVQTITPISDRRLKKNIKALDLGLDFVKRLKPVSYRFNDNDETLRFGFIAQDLEQALPPAMQEMVETGKPSGLALLLRENDADRTYRISYGELYASLVKSIQERQARIDAVKKQIARLTGRIDRLKAKKQDRAALFDKQTAELDELRQEIGEFSSIPAE